MYELSGVTKDYKKGRATVHALAGVDLRISDGEWLAIQGPTGHGKTTLLQIEKIAQAAAQQRAGRCGRVQNGIAVRLFGADDLAARPAYTEPEILRSSLAGVILRMKSLNLGQVEDFPFLEAPPKRAIVSVRPSSGRTRAGSSDSSASPAW